MTQPQNIRDALSDARDRAKKVLDLLLDGRPRFAEEFADREINSHVIVHGIKSPTLLVAKGMCSIMNAFMSFEDDDMENARLAMMVVEENHQNRERFVHGTGIASWFGFNGSFDDAVKKNPDVKYLKSKEVEYEFEVCYADSQQFRALLLFLNQDIRGLIRGGLMMRSALKQYHNCAQLRESILKRNFLAMEANLKDAVNLGLGNMNLIMSLIPPRYLKLLSFMGYSSDKESALERLRQCAESPDPRSGWSNLTLIWYLGLMEHYYMMPNYSPEVGEMLVDRNLVDYPDSVLIRWFKGRMEKIRGNFGSAIENFQLAYDGSKDVRQIQHMSAYELGWCHMLAGTFDEALEHFAMMAKENKWSNMFYQYLCAICYAMMGNDKGMQELIDRVVDTRPRKIAGKDMPMERFLSYRAHQVQGIMRNEKVKIFLCLEVFYLWNFVESLPVELQDEYCFTLEHLALDECKNPENPEASNKEKEKAHEMQLDLYYTSRVIVAHIHRVRGRLDQAEAVLNEVLLSESDIPSISNALINAYFEKASYHYACKEYKEALIWANKANKAKGDALMDGRVATRSHVFAGVVERILAEGNA
eukprot:Clim_evm35s242 gene=Clim_evmTU35s242